MAPASKALLNLTAADLMSASVVMVPEEMSLQGAAHMLAQSHVTGAPIVNHEGKCVGVLSSTDFVRWVEKHQPAATHNEERSSFCSVWQIIDPGHLPVDAVHNYMTRDPVTVEPTTPIGTLARMMMDAHIHRVIVVDHRGRPVGIVSATDVLAAVALADRARTTTTETGKHLEPLSCSA
jgi:CBS domain-containing protein